MLKIVKWVILGLIGLVIGFFLLVPAISPFRYKSYIYATTYPAACWTDDGKQIIYLEHREIRRGTFPKVYASKTYLMIMDANGKNKKVVGEVVHPKDRENFDNAMKKYEEGKIFLTNFGKFESIDKSMRIEHHGNIIGKYFYIVDAKQMTKILLKLDIKKSKSYLFMPFWWRV